MSRPACRSAGTGTWAGWPWRRQDRVQRRAGADHPCQSAWDASDDARPVAMEDAAPPDRSSDAAAEKLVDLELDVPARDDLQSALRGFDRRRLVHRTRPGLRDDHSRSRRLRTRRSWPEAEPGRQLALAEAPEARSAAARWAAGTHLRRRRRRSNWTRRCRTRRRWRRYGSWSLRRHNRYNRRRERRALRSNTCRSNHARRRSWRRYRRNWRLSSRRRRGSRLSFMNRRRCRTRRSSRCGRRSRLLVSDNGFQNISGLGDVRQVDLGLDLFWPGMGGRDALAEPCPSPEPRKCARTLSASKSSSELEWVFFSVTPTSVNTSRIDLLFTSSSLARSLIRILLIRLFVPPNLSR